MLDFRKSHWYVKSNIEFLSAEKRVDQESIRRDAENIDGDSNRTEQSTKLREGQRRKDKPSAKEISQINGSVLERKPGSKAGGTARSFDEAGKSKPNERVGPNSRGTIRVVTKRQKMSGKKTGPSLTHPTSTSE